MSQFLKNLSNKITMQMTVIARVLLFSVLLSCFSVGSANAATDTWFANGDGTVTDVATGLIWQQQDDNMGRSHTDALTYCQGLTLAGNSNWRLPNIKELTSIVDYRADSPAIDETAFLSTTSSRYWSASNRVSNLSGAHFVSFDSGIFRSSDKTNEYFARCVR